MARKTSARRHTLAALVVSAMVLHNPSANGLNEDYPSAGGFRTGWKANKLTIETNEYSSSHRVIETISWTTEWSMSQLSCPNRTPCGFYGHGMYEWELRFRGLDSSSDDNWCDEDNGEGDVVTFLPSPDGEGGYHDNDPSGDEFTWGFKAVDVNEDWIYSIDFRCWPNDSTYTDRYTVSGQLGHCHGPLCTQYNTFADEFVTYIPKRWTQAPDSQNLGGPTFSGNPGFEQGISPWTMHNERPASGLVCDNPSPYQGQCYVFLRSQAGERGRFQLKYDPGNRFLAQGATYSEFFARCPSAWNSGSCQIRLVIAALDEQGDVVGVHTGDWRAIDNNDIWYRVTRAVVPNGGSSSSPNTAWPESARSWRYWIESGEGESFDADLHQQGFKEHLT